MVGSRVDSSGQFEPPSRFQRMRQVLFQPDCALLHDGLRDSNDFSKIRRRMGRGRATPPSVVTSASGPCGIRSGPSQIHTRPTSGSGAEPRFLPRARPRSIAIKLCRDAPLHLGQASVGAKVRRSTPDQNTVPAEPFVRGTYHMQHSKTWQSGRFCVSV